MLKISFQLLSHNVSISSSVFVHTCAPQLMFIFHRSSCNETRENISGKFYFCKALSHRENIGETTLYVLWSETVCRAQVKTGKQKMVECLPVWHRTLISVSCFFFFLHWECTKKITFIQTLFTLLHAEMQCTLLFLITHASLSKAVPVTVWSTWKITCE